MAESVPMVYADNGACESTYSALIAANGVCDLRRDVQEVKADIRDSIQTQSLNFTGQFMHLHDKMCEADKDALRANYEARLETKDAIFKLNEKIDNEHERTNDKIEYFRNYVEKEFCGLNLSLEKKFGVLKERDLEAQLREVKRELTAEQGASQTKQILDAIAASCSTE